MIASAIAILAVSAAAAFAAPVLQPGVTSWPGMSGVCTDCHTYATPPVVDPPVVDPPVVDPPVVDPPVVTPPSSGDGSGSDSGHDYGFENGARRWHHHHGRHGGRRDA